MFGFKKVAMPKSGEALPGRAQPIRTATAHFISHHALKGPYPDGTDTAMFGLGSLWGAERKLWEHRLSLVRDEAVDRDVLEERARESLGRIHKNDVIMMGR